jgi:hypothetical protein
MLQHGLILRMELTPKHSDVANPQILTPQIRIGITIYRYL